ncbi:DNA polymerase, beta-like region [Pseudorhizobium banfieldiae]|uniref:DNA polymerase, beta-like region n=1 Tax=Pseudorhizobium banfieldiae TaxID=1125847 RepID=L0NH60_9HYPH|nr:MULTISPECIES: nucleotidyltransferase family protein [Pseudorhizobium]CAD6615277.1 nucleotidyltransferase [arsenite-oxidising bacterium NT-25]CAD6618202.1 nucleotidyltransferase [Rhizobium sp. TCK]CCF20209.1 DNA polymerase, beta-like region [Pseudorhizobium banfieldiae]
MRPSEVLEKNREAIRRIVARRSLSNPRVFGSVLRGEDVPGSDLDILVDPSQDTSLLTLGGLEGDLSEALGIRVDVKVPGDFPPAERARIVSEAVAI